MLLWTACSDQASGPAAPDGPFAQAVTQLEIARALPSALRLQSLFTNELLTMPGVVGSAVALGDDGLPTVVALVEHGGVRVPPGMRVIVTGKLSALDWQAVPQGKPTCGKGKLDPCDEEDPPPEEPAPEPSPNQRFLRPVPIGVSTGHPDITAGTIGARVTNGTDVFALSNNHVYANVNAASTGDADAGTPGDAVIQPGYFDGGRSSADDIGTLFAFEPIVFETAAGTPCTNVMDAAIALSHTDDLGNATPSAGYGIPLSTTVAAALNMKVKKFGRTTGLTKGTVAAVNATVRVGYGTGTPGIACFTGQIIISPGTFSAGGDSGSLVVGDRKGRSREDDGKPVGLLFAGSASYTIISPIGLILDRFGVTIDGN